MNEAASSVEPEVKTRFATVDDAVHIRIKQNGNTILSKLNLKD
jgi:hypothetical protein